MEISAPPDAAACPPIEPWRSSAAEHLKSTRVKGHRSRSICIRAEACRVSFGCYSGVRSVYLAGEKQLSKRHIDKVPPLDELGGWIRWGQAKLGCVAPTGGFDHAFTLDPTMNGANS
uniref:Uncharacterized protein n=1 Tax=Leersia perrieri TaxID=77586 RepID=A0A0D9UW11_9ORYZ